MIAVRKIHLSIRTVTRASQGRIDRKHRTKHLAALGTKTLNHYIQIENQLTTGTAENLDEKDLAVQNYSLHLRNNKGKGGNCKDPTGHL